MGKKKRGFRDTIECIHYRWHLYMRSGVYYADGRSNTPALGRHSLAVGDRLEAVGQLKKLDLTMAIRNGLVAPVQNASTQTSISIAEGNDLYLKHAGRSQVTGGVASSTLERYTTALKNFSRFLSVQRVERWDTVTTQVVNDYATYRERSEKAAGTISFEITTIVQAFKFLKETDKLSPTTRLKVRIQKHRETTRYCWQEAEVIAMVELCQQDPNLHWLKRVIIGLACTGLRIQELLGLRWRDIREESGMIHLSDDRSRKSGGCAIRRTKNHTSRTLPIHPDLHAILDSADKSQDGFVFLAPNGKEIKYDFVRKHFIKSVLQPLADRLTTASNSRGIKDGTLHSFRHYFCSRCANEGIPENVLMRWMGHRQSDMIRHYYHLHDAESKRHIGNVQFVKSPQPQ